MDIWGDIDCPKCKGVKTLHVAYFDFDCRGNDSYLGASCKKCKCELLGTDLISALNTLKKQK